MEYPAKAKQRFMTVKNVLSCFAPDCWSDRPSWVWTQNSLLLSPTWSWYAVFECWDSFEAGWNSTFVLCMVLVLISSSFLTSLFLVCVYLCCVQSVPICLFSLWHPLFAHGAVEILIQVLPFISHVVCALCNSYTDPECRLVFAFSSFNSIP